LSRKDQLTAVVSVESKNFNGNYKRESKLRVYAETELTLFVAYDHPLSVFSAVYSLDGAFLIIVDENYQISMVDAGTNRVVNQINLSFPNLHEDIQVNEYRAYYLKILHDGNLIAFGAYFTDEDALAENIGSTMMFFLGKLKPDSTTETLNSKAFFWNDMNHVSDDIDRLPMIKLDYIECGDQCLYFAQQNHNDSPFTFLVQNGKLEVCYQIVDPSFPKVYLPYVDADR